MNGRRWSTSESSHCQEEHRTDISYRTNWETVLITCEALQRNISAFLKTHLNFPPTTNKQTLEKDTSLETRCGLMKAGLLWQDYVSENAFVSTHKSDYFRVPVQHNLPTTVLAKNAYFRQEWPNRPSPSRWAYCWTCLTETQLCLITFYISIGAGTA